MAGPFEPGDEARGVEQTGFVLRNQFIGVGVPKPPWAEEVRTWSF